VRALFGPELSVSSIVSRATLIGVTVDRFFGAIWSQILYQRGNIYANATAIPRPEAIVKIDLKWDKPIRLRDRSSKMNLIYACRDRDLKRIPDKAGVYVFARRFGQLIAPLYIGQSSSLKKRIDFQFGNARLMMGIKHADAGHRILLFARLRLHPGQQEQKVLDIVESALIKHALTEGHELLNKQFTKTKVHTVRSKGNISAKQIAPLYMYVER
jgi:hypothetical protein